MKYKKLVIIVMILSVFIITGCGSKKVDNVTDDTIEEQTSETIHKINVTEQ